jgi:hypothetical protein
MIHFHRNYYYLHCVCSGATAHHQPCMTRGPEPTFVFLMNRPKFCSLPSLTTSFVHAHSDFVLQPSVSPMMQVKAPPPTLRSSFNTNVNLSRRHEFVEVTRIQIITVVRITFFTIYVKLLSGALAMFLIMYNIELQKTTLFCTLSPACKPSRLILFLLGKILRSPTVRNKNQLFLYHIIFKGL